MSLLVAMLPIYIFGNLHCLGMCGPLVFMLGQHRYRYFYFLGRLLSFTLAGMIAGEIGFLVNAFFQQYHISAAASGIFGGLMIATGICSLFGHYPGQRWLSLKLAGVNKNLSLLMLRDQPLATFLFGFFTIALPCGQTIVVYTACALSGDMWVGMINGLAFALLTSPSLFLAMSANKIFARLKKHHQQIIGWGAIFVGMLAVCRSLADWGKIPHLTFNLPWTDSAHVVIF